MLGAKVLVVDDDRRVLDLLSLYLKKAGYSTVTAVDGEAGLAEYRRQHPALVILDIMMPKMDGWEVCRRIRQNAATPIIMLTAKEDEFDKILGLELGADDYITKPFSPREVAARVRAVLRRAIGGEGARANSKLEWPGLCIDPIRRKVIARGQDVKLSPKEFDLLLYMARRPGQVLTREQLYDAVWGYDFYGGIRSVDVHVARLRNKLEANSKNPSLLVTIWGVGYKFEEPQITFQ